MHPGSAAGGGGLGQLDGMTNPLCSPPVSQFDGLVDIGLDDSGNAYVLTNTRMQKYT